LVREAGMFKTSILSAAAISLFAGAASAATIVAYDTVNSAGNIAGEELGTGVTANDLTRGAGLVFNSAGGDYNSRNWTQGGDLATAIANEDFLEWGFTSTLGYDLTSMSLHYDRSTTGAMDIAILASINGGAFTSIFTDSSISASGETNILSLMATNVTSAVFRLAGWSATNPLGTFDIETNEVGPGNAYGLVIEGNLTPVPLPTGLALMLTAFGAFGVARRRA